MKIEMNAELRKKHDALIKLLISQGKLIEAGFEGLRISVIAPDAPAGQVDEMRMAFMAGAQHLFASIMSVLDAESDPTEADMRRMGLISDELDAYAKQLQLRVAVTGRAQ